MRKPTIIAVTAVVAGFAIAGCDADPMTEDAPTVAATTAAEDEAVPTEEAETEESEPEAAPGTRDNPLPLGTLAQVGADYEVAVTEVIIDGANEIMADPELFNEPSELGQYVIVTLEGTFLGTEYPEGDPGLDLSAVIVGSDAKQYSDTDTFGTPPNDLSSGPTLEAGGEFSGNFALSMPPEALEGALLFIEPLAAFDNDQRAFWAMP
jgi:hypothetical protein